MKAVWMQTSSPAHSQWWLDFALALTFIGIVIPLLVTRPMLAAAATAGLVALLAHGLPYNLGIVLAGCCGIMAGLITYAIRLAPMLALERFTLSLQMRQALRFVPVAVLSVIILPEVAMPAGGLDLSLHNEWLIGGLVAVIVAWRSRNVLWTIAAGMAVLWLWPEGGT